MTAQSALAGPVVCGVYFGCGCTVQSTAPIDSDFVNFPLTNPRTGERHDIPLLWLSKQPPMLVELGWMDRPEWAKTCHAMEWFDVRKVDAMNWQEFDHLFSGFRQEFGPMVPRCWISDMMTGSGRFYGLWKRQAIFTRAVGHLRVVDKPEEADGPPLAP